MRTSKHTNNDSSHTHKYPREPRAPPPTHSAARRETLNTMPAHACMPQGCTHACMRHAQIHHMDKSTHAYTQTLAHKTQLGNLRHLVDTELTQRYDAHGHRRQQNPQQRNK
jgi:hypothetical protein